MLVLLAALLLPAAAGGAGPPITVTCNGAVCASSWYTTNVTVAYVWDPTGVVSTSGCNTTTVSSDTAGATFTCTLTYGNGATAALPVTVKRDATPPSVSGAGAARGPDANGWYNHAVGVAFNGSDATSGLASCTSATYGGPDTGGASLAGTCRDNAGNVSAPASFGPIKYDATPPAVHVALSRGPDAGSWYNHPVSFSASGSDNLSGVASCSSGTIPGSTAASCTDNAGNVGSAGVGASYDASPPSISSVTFDRPPDSNGWYNHAVEVAFHGSDGGSGIASCATVTYAGPDTGSTTVSGTCRDNAGNTSSSTSPAFKYDSTPPTLANVGTDWDDGTATLSWQASADATTIEIDRAPGQDGAGSSTVYKGQASSFEDSGLQNKVKYTYTITALDDAGNKAVDSVTIIPGAKLYAPARGATIASPPLLAWRPYDGASYYNIQLYYGVGNSFRRVAGLTVSGKKVLSAWPTQPRYRLKTAWKWNGKARKLARGHYRWYVFPGLGKKSANKYGPLIGSSDFFVSKR
jgi:hypothetical protein